MASPQAALPPTESQPPGVIAGVVTDSASGTPIRRAVVTLSTIEALPQDAVAWTDSNGRFSFSYLMPGRYQLRAQKTGYQNLAYGAKTASSPAGTIQLGAGEGQTGIVFRMQLANSISGIVLGDDGEPVAGAQVMAMASGFQRQKRKLLQGPGVATDSNGHYRLTGLAPGQYAVVATLHPSRGVGKANSEVSAKQPQPPQQYSFASQYYPGVGRSESATLLTVRGGQELTGIDFRLNAQPLVALQGRIIAPPGLKSSERVSIQVISEEVAYRTTFETGAVAPEYTFQFDSLFQGSYLLVTQATADGKRYRGVQRLEIGATGLKDFAITLEPGIDIAGSVSVEGPNAAKYDAGYVRLVSGDNLMNGLPLRANVNKDGTFKVTGVTPGIWDIDVGPIPKGGYIKSMLLGERDVLTQDMEIRSATTGNLKIVLSTRAASLTGDVAREDQPSRAVVVLAPEAKYRHVTSFYRIVIADDNGHFEIKNAVPGRYQLYAFEEFDRRSIEDPNALKPFEAAGIPVTLSEGPNESQKLSVLLGAPQ